MKKIILIGCLMSLGAFALRAQESDLEAVKRQLKEATESFQKAMEQQRQVIEALTKKVNQLETQQAGVTNQQAELKKLVQAGAPAAPAGEAMTPVKNWSPSDPIRVSKGAAYAELGMVGTFAAGTSTTRDLEGAGGLEPGGHDRGGGIRAVGADLVLLNRLHAWASGARADPLLLVLRPGAHRHDGRGVGGQPVHALHLL